MKAKNTTLFFICILSFFLLVNIISAGVTFDATGNTVTVKQGDTVTVTFTVTEDGEGNLTDITFNTPLTLSHGSDNLVSATTISGAITELDENETSAEMTLTFDVSDTQATGTYTGNLTLTGNYTDEVNYNLPIQITVTQKNPDWTSDFCIWDGDDDVRDIENPGDLSVKIDDIRVVGDSFGDDESWFPFDSVEVDILVDNKGDDDVNNIEIEWGLYDKDNDVWVIDIDNEKDFDLKDGDDETITIEFKIDDKMDVDLEDLDDGDQYILYVRASGEVEDDDDTPTCDADSETVELVIERDFVIVTNLDLFSDTVSCGSNLEITADVYNVGSRDQDEVSVRVIVRDLDYDKEVLVGDINAFDKEKLDITIPIPKNAKEGTYAITFEVYDEDSDIYENDFDDEESKTVYSFTVQGSCSTSSGGDTSDLSVIISANLESGGYVGEPLVIKAMITNTGDEEGTFLINIADYISWANSADLNKETIILDSGDSEEIMITFDVKPEAVGDQLFKIQVVTDQQIIADQPVSVTIEGKETTGISTTFGDSWYLWLIGALNVILIIIIIVVAVRLARK